MESTQLDDSTVASRLALARGLLRHKTGPEPVWPVLASAALFMVCALGFAAAVITAPGPEPFTPVVEDVAP